VGLQPDIPLARRVQLAVVAHIRHTRTRYDLLLRETSWLNARKVVEPICLDFIVKWRGDEETGRDQMEEILREVVVLSDSEDDDDDDDDSSEEEDDEESSDDEVEITSVSTASTSRPNSRNESRPMQPQLEAHKPQGTAVSEVTRLEDKKAHRGFSRYQAAWDHALTRQQVNPSIPEAGSNSTYREDQYSRSRPLSGMALPQGAQYSTATINVPCGVVQERPRYAEEAQVISHQVSRRLRLLSHILYVPC
jgi:hypothetical protein